VFHRRAFHRNSGCGAIPGARIVFSRRGRCDRCHVSHGRLRAGHLPLIRASLEDSGSGIFCQISCLKICCGLRRCGLELPAHHCGVGSPLQVVG